MKENKGVALRIFAITFAALFAVCVFALKRFYDVKAIKSRLDVDKGKQTLTFNGDGDVKILQLTDTQILQIDEVSLVFETVRRTVEKAKPDLIVLTGDNVSDNSGLSLFLRLVKGMDSFGIPWAPVLGNHDYRSLVSTQTQAKLYESAKFCLFQTGDVADSYGNYYYKLKRNGKTVYSFLFMDSGKGFEEAHVEWYEKTTQTVANQNDGVVLPSWVFFHIPTEETQLAYESGLKGETVMDGEVNEKICIQSRNVGFFDAVKRGGTTALIYGHDHVNTMITDYQGVKLCYGVKTGKTSYYEDRLQGGNLFRLKKDNTFTVERIFV